MRLECGKTRGKKRAGLRNLRNIGDMASEWENPE
jgi:hypothetical protein